MFLIGYDIGTSSVKASIVNSENGKCVADAFMPEKEAPIIALEKGWAEQDPESWWYYLKLATKAVLEKSNVKPENIKAIGISYQMHGLVCVDKQLKPFRNSIIWCDSRAVPLGEEAFKGIGESKCMEHLLNSPANFTAAKLAWVKRNEPKTFEQIFKIMLPGDFIVMKMSGTVNTTVSGLSEGIFWDFKNNSISYDVLDFFGFDKAIIPDVVDTFSIQARLSKQAAEEIGLMPDTPIAYRGGDQPNNALSLNVMKPGEIAATAGTSGVVYGVLGNINYDEKSRVNVFAHVNHSSEKTRLGVLLCINGTGIMNAWTKRNVATVGMSYNEMNDMAEKVPIGADGLSVIPFGNGAERILNNKDLGCSIQGLNFNIHTRNHILRAEQEGIVFSFKRGIDIMSQMGMNVSNIHAGNANMFMSSLFRKTLATVADAVIDLYNTDGAAGAAKGAGIGAKTYKDCDEAFATLEHVGQTLPDTKNRQQYIDAYNLWNERLEKLI